VSIEALGLSEFDPTFGPMPPIAADVEILDAYRGVAAYAEANPVYLVAGDLGMRLRANARGIQLRVMPPALRQPLSTEPDESETA